MNAQQLRDNISQQCGFTPNKAEQGVNYTAVQACNAGDWPSVEDQQRYWQERDETLDRIESATQWFDNKRRESF